MPAQCDRCGAQTEIAESFVQYRRSFRSITETVCPRCWTKAHTSFQKWLFLFNFLIGGIGLLIFIWLPKLKSGSVFLNLFFFQIFMAATILPHELGHAWAAKALGWRVFKLYVGLGRTLFARTIFGFETEFKAIPMLGLAFATPRSKRYFRIKRFGFILAGPLANLFLAMPGLLLLPSSEVFDLNWLEQGIAPGKAFFYANLITLIVNLFPFDFTTPFGKLPSDGKALWQCFSLKGESIDNAHAGWYVMEGATAHQKSQYAEARGWFENGLTIYPGNPALLNWLGIVLLDLNNFVQARSCFLQLLPHPKLDAAGRAMILNNVAYADVLAGDADLLHEADRYSEEAMKNLGWLAPVKGTRGCVLLELGRIEQAIPLLLEAMRENDLASSKALNACSLAIAEARRGACAEAKKFIEEARRLNPSCFLLPRAEEAVRESTPPKVVE